MLCTLITTRNLAAHVAACDGITDPASGILAYAAGLAASLIAAHLLCKLI